MSEETPIKRTLDEVKNDYGRKIAEFGDVKFHIECLESTAKRLAKEIAEINKEAEPLIAEQQKAQEAARAVPVAELSESAVSV